MRILACADIHGRRRVLDHIIYSIEEYRPEITVIAGDITHFGTGPEVAEILNEIPGKVLAVPGNCDPKDSVEWISRSKAKSLHGELVEIGGLKFFGIGGSNVTPFRTMFELSEGEFERHLSGARGIDVLVTHVPPYGILDEPRKGLHTGSRAVRDFVLKEKPILHIFGHIHEARGVEREEGIVFVNATCGHLAPPMILEISGREVKILKA